MEKTEKDRNRRIIIMAFLVITLASIAMIVQFKTLYEIGSASSRQVFIISATAIMQMAAILIASLQKTRTLLAETKALAYADELTGLINRRRFNQLLDRALKKSRAKNQKIGILILDLDRFKLINDCYGHDAGDKVICQFGERIQKIVDKSSVTCRMSGDEFAVFIKDVTSKDDILTVCHGILSEMKQPFIYESKKIHASVSIGAAIVDGYEDDTLTALRMADFALLSSKESGRNRVMLFNTEMAAQIKRRRNLEKGLSEAISGEVLSLKYQPFVLQEDKSISGVEALIRWNHPEEGEILPSEFIPVAQELGLLEEIGEFILERACSEIKPFDNLRLAVNINPEQFSQDGFVNQVKRVLKKTGFEPSRLEFELGQNLLVSKSEKIKSDLKALRSLGVRIALDDFGTSYSSMFFLREFKLDRIKLDRNFVSNMRYEKDGDEIIDNMIGLGSTFGDRLTIEGIETEEQLNAVQQNGSNDLQGFLFSKPLTLRELEESQMVTDIKNSTALEDSASNVATLPINRIAG